MPSETKFSELAWEKNKTLYDKTLRMPFNEELRQGTLSKDRFQHYIIQDAKYLEAYAKVFALAAVKSDHSKHTAYLSDVVSSILNVERSIHARYFKEFHVTAEFYKKVETSPSCLLYTSYLLSTGYKEPLSVIMAALLPCAWIYGEIGKAIKASSAENNPYQLWIDQYGGKEFDKSVQEMIQIVDELAENESDANIEKMFQAYTTSARLEYMFWEGAYKMEKWIS